MKKYIQLTLAKIIIIFFMTPVVMLALGWEQTSLRDRIIATIIVVIGLVVYDIYIPKRKARGFEIVSLEHRKHPEIDIQLPIYGDEEAMGADIYSPESVVLQPGETHLIWTDVKAYMSSDEGAIVNGRSSTGAVKVRLANIQGWIDASYYGNKKTGGNIGVLLSNEGTEPYKVEQGDRIAQIMFQKVLRPENYQYLNKERKGGFGSSGK